MMTDEQIGRAQEIWAEYQKQHDVTARNGQAVGIDPVSGRVWFGESAIDIRKQMDAVGDPALLFLLRVGRNYYARRG
jgi:hypothetical protein